MKSTIQSRKWSATSRSFLRRNGTLESQQQTCCMTGRLYCAIFRSMRRSGMSHITATRM
jgi:hypothetical protein